MTGAGQEMIVVAMRQTKTRRSRAGIRSTLSVLSSESLPRLIRSYLNQGYR